MGFYDYSELFVAAFLLLVGEKYKDNLYRTGAAVMTMLAISEDILSPTPRLGADERTVLLGMTLYLFSMWIMQPQIRPQNNTQEKPR